MLHGDPASAGDIGANKSFVRRWLANAKRWTTSNRVRAVAAVISAIAAVVSAAATVHGALGGGGGPF